MPRVSVLMPTFRQAAFLRRAIESLRGQSLADWELIVVDDGSPDETQSVLSRYTADPRVRCRELRQNAGLGAALNVAIEEARAPLVAYLPSDDVYYRDHLASLADCLEAFPSAALAFSGVRHHYNRYSPGKLPDYPLELVQVMHRLTADRWPARHDLESDDLERLFWSRLRRHGEFVGTGSVTCEWVDHPRQRHKILCEPDGGVNPYRVWCGVREPLRIHTTTGNPIDEGALYEPYRKKRRASSAGGLRILLTGELAYNPDRILALEERGHKLFGLWMPNPQWYNSVGPLPFGHVTDVPAAGWREALRRIRPDVIYALLNWQAVPFAHQVLKERPRDIPFVWHFKEGPFICLERGAWPQLIELYTQADGRIYSSPEMQAWFQTVLPRQARGAPSLVLDGDLPKRDWLFAERCRPLSEQDGEVHTVSPGRPIGLHPSDVAELASERVHLHLYGEFIQGQWRAWIEKAKRLAPDHLHLHPHVGSDRWVSEFSRYDAGWLQYFESDNRGDLTRANWDDLNYPARMATLLAAGVPLLQRDNTGCVVATQSLARRLDIGIFVRGMKDAASQLRDCARMAELRANAWRCREEFTFDQHVERLLAFFRAVIASRFAQTGDDFRALKSFA